MLLAERAQHAAELPARDQARATDQELIARLIRIIRDLQRTTFGARSEKLDPDQLALALEDLEPELAAAAVRLATPTERTERAVKRRANRGALPAHLPRLEQVIDIADKVCPCCSSALHRIGEGRRRAAGRNPGDVPGLGHPPAQVWLPRLRGGRGAVARARAGDRGRAADGGDRRPCDRGQVRRPLPAVPPGQAYARQGVLLDRSTLAHWMGSAAELLTPVHTRLLERLKASGKLLADETRAPVLDPGRGRTKLGQLWAYAHDDRPWGGPEPPGVAFVYSGDRAASSPALHLAGFRGVLQVDGYGAYKALAKEGAVELAFCWAHARRCFHKELDPNDPSKTRIATEAVARIQELYAVEAEIRGRSPEQRRVARQEKSAPILNALKPWLGTCQELISQKSDLAKAIQYTLNHWDGLNRFLEDGRIEIDSNTVERTIRPLALTRKNSLFAGSQGGAHQRATLASLIATCKVNDVEPQGYLTDILTKLVNGPCRAA